MNKKVHRFYIGIIIFLLCMNITLFIGKPNPETTNVSEAYPEMVSSAKGEINLNTATVDDLMTIDGIGPATARKIIARRNELGGRFRVLDDLLSVDGISQKKFDRFREDLYVDEESNN